MSQDEIDRRFVAIVARMAFDEVIRLFSPYLDTTGETP